MRSVIIIYIFLSKVNTIDLTKLINESIIQPITVIINIRGVNNGSEFQSYRKQNKAKA